MPKERTRNDRERRPAKVRGGIIVQPIPPVSGDLLPQEAVPKHLEPLKENYEVSMFTDEVLKRKRLKADDTITTMTESTVDASLDINDKIVEGVEILDAEPMRTVQRNRAINQIDHLQHIANLALRDGLEWSAARVNDVADSDPRTQKPADTSIEIDDLTWPERFTGKVRRKK